MNACAVLGPDGSWNVVFQSGCLFLFGDLRVHFAAIFFKAVSRTHFFSPPFLNEDAVSFF